MGRHRQIFFQELNYLEFKRTIKSIKGRCNAGFSQRVCSGALDFRHLFSFRAWGRGTVAAAHRAARSFHGACAVSRSPTGLRSAGDGANASASAIDQVLAILAPGDVCQVASVLRGLARTSGNHAFERGARAVLGRRSGRHALKDDAAIAEMARALDDRAAGSVACAARYAAAKLPGRQSLDSAAKRLERKYREKFGTKY